MGRGKGHPDKLQLDDIERFSIDGDYTIDADALRIKAQATFLSEQAEIINAPGFSVWDDLDEWADDKEKPIFVDKNGLIAQAIRTGEPEEEFKAFLLAVGKYLFESEGERANDFIRSHRSAFGFYEAATPWMVLKNINARHHFVESLGSSEMLCGAVLSFPERLAYRGAADSGYFSLCSVCQEELKKLPPFDPRHALLEETQWQVSGETIGLHDTLEEVLRQATLDQMQRNLSKDKPLANLRSQPVIDKARQSFAHICFASHVAKSDRERFEDLFETTPNDLDCLPDESRPLLALLTKSIRSHYGENPKMPPSAELWKALEEDIEDWGNPLTRGVLIGAHIHNFFPEVKEDLNAYTAPSTMNNQIRKICGLAPLLTP